MRVLLQRDLFMGGSRYRRDRTGTELPEFVDGRKVVFKSDTNNPETEFVLPKDAKPFEEPDAPKAGDLVRTGRPKPKALSQLTPKSKSIDED